MTPLAAVVMIVLHTVDGREVHINPAHVVTMREAREHDQRLVAGEVRCVISLVDGKYQSVIEPCDTVRELLGK